MFIPTLGAWTPSPVDPAPTRRTNQGRCAPGSFAAPLVFWTAGTIGLIANAFVLLLAARLVDGFDVDGFWWALVGSLVMTVFAVLVAGLLAVDDDDVWRRNTMRRMVGCVESPVTTDVPGVLFLQIDGLSAPVLRQAVRDGDAPTQASWVRSGSHRIVEWECDLSSQTGASQAGILLGDNTDMPAFRWYDKDAGRVVTTNRPHDAAEIERQQSDGTGLLIDGGVSRAHLFSGDSSDSMFTFSTVAARPRTATETNALIDVLSDPYFFSRLLVLGRRSADRAHPDAAARWCQLILPAARSATIT